MHAYIVLWDPVDTPAASNWLVIQDDHSRAILYLGSHKTSRRTGPNRIELKSSDATSVLLQQLVAFVCRERDVLLQGNARPAGDIDWLFLVSIYIYIYSAVNLSSVAVINMRVHSCMQNNRGEPYTTADSWTKYVQSIFKHLTGASVSSNALRSSFVTGLMTSCTRPTDDLLAEVAFTMRHSSREQGRTYDRRSSSDKVTRAVALASERVAIALDTSGGSAASSMTRQPQGRPDDEDVAPEIGDIVAAVDDSSTPSKPYVYFGKVLRVYLDKKEALLGELVQQSMCTSSRRSITYKLKIGCGAWIEPFQSLVYPVDMQYCASSGMYSLRTPLRDIHDDVLGKKGPPLNAADFAEDV